MIGKTVSHYKIIEELGRGGMGVVYKAEDAKLGRRVVLKFLPPDLTRDPDARVRFINEARSASALDHPNICIVHAIDETEDRQLYICMAHYDGVTLKERLTHGCVRIAEAVDIAIQIAKGLAKAHEKGIVHRDIKPGNVIITSDGVVKIIDFGLSKLMGVKSHTRTGSTLGTVAYMSPEQAHGLSVDQRTDIWSLGVVLYEMLSGELPFKGEYEQAVLYAIINQPIIPITQCRPDVCSALERVLHTMLHKTPDNRYQSAVAVLEDLANLNRAANSTLATAKRAAKVKKPNQRKKIVGAIVGLACAALLSGILSRRGSHNNSSENSADSISPNRIAIMPFAVHGSEELDYLGDGMMDLLSIKLDGAGELRRVDPYALQNYLTRYHTGTLDPERAREIAKQFGAGLYVVGAVYGMQGQMQFTASLYDVSFGLRQTVETRAMEEENIFVLVDDLARRLLAARTDIDGKRLQSLAAVTTNSAAALKAYLDGESKARAGQYDLAVDTFGQAVQEDSTFALAYYGMAAAAAKSPERYDERTKALERAIHYSDRLAPRERMRLNALYSSQNGAAEVAERLLREILNEYPNDDAWFQLGILLLRYGPRQGRQISEARIAMENARTLDPEQAITVGFLQEIAGIEHNAAAFDSLTELRLRLAPQGDYAWYNRALLAFSRGDRSAQEEVMALANKAPSFHLWFTSLELAANINHFEGAKRIARLLVNPSRSASWRARGYGALARIEFAQGKQAAGMEALFAGENVYEGFLLQQRGLLLMTPLLQFTAADLMKLEPFISNRRSDDSLSPIYGHYQLGLLYAHLGDYEKASRHADSLAHFAEQFKRHRNSEKSAALAADLRHSIRAKIQWNIGKPEQALEELQQIRLEGWWRPVASKPIDTQAYERYMRAEVLRALGKREEAIRWLSTLGGGIGGDVQYLAPSQLLQGEIYEETGQPDRAIGHYSRFIGLWKDCDSVLQPKVDEVRRKITQLSQRIAYR